MYCARSKAAGSGQFIWLMLPLSCSIDSYSCCSIHSRIFPLHHQKGDKDLPSFTLIRNTPILPALIVIPAEFRNSLGT